MPGRDMVTWGTHSFNKCVPRVWEVPAPCLDGGGPWAGLTRPLPALPWREGCRIVGARAVTSVSGRRGTHSQVV